MISSNSELLLFAVYRLLSWLAFVRSVLPSIVTSAGIHLVSAFPVIGLASWLHLPRCSPRGSIDSRIATLRRPTYLMYGSTGDLKCCNGVHAKRDAVEERACNILLFLSLTRKAHPLNQLRIVRRECRLTYERRYPCGEP
ncbi:MAG: hypothetical protein V4793_15875 [Paraburkholderia tropica]